MTSYIASRPARNASKCSCCERNSTDVRSHSGADSRTHAVAGATIIRIIVTNVRNAESSPFSVNDDQQTPIAMYMPPSSSAPTYDVTIGPVSNTLSPESTTKTPQYTSVGTSIAV